VRIDAERDRRVGGGKAEVLVPASGGTVSNLQVSLGANAAGSGNLVEVTDNGTVIISCTVTSGTSTCSDTTTSVTVSAGHFLQVSVTNNAGAQNREYLVSFRF